MEREREIIQAVLYLVEKQSLMENLNYLFIYLFIFVVLGFELGLVLVLGRCSASFFLC
jgi:hypothetical protein